MDGCLSRALNVKLDNDRLAVVDKFAYVLTLDYTIKMLDIHERFKCGIPVIIEGETGVGKTALVEMLSRIWNHLLLLKWDDEQARLLDFIRKRLNVTSNLDAYQVTEWWPNNNVCRCSYVCSNACAKSDL